MFLILHLILHDDVLNSLKMLLKCLKNALEILDNCRYSVCYFIRTYLIIKNASSRECLRNSREILDNFPVATAFNYTYYYIPKKFFKMLETEILDNYPATKGRFFRGCVIRGCLVISTFPHFSGRPSPDHSSNFCIPQIHLAKLCNQSQSLRQR